MPDMCVGMVAAVHDDDGSEHISLPQRESWLHLRPAPLPLCRHWNGDAESAAFEQKEAPAPPRRDGAVICVAARPEEEPTRRPAKSFRPAALLSAIRRSMCPVSDGRRMPWARS
jgi:hypothetical protein